MFRTISDQFNLWLNNPIKVLIWGGVFTVILLLSDGSLWRLWSLQRGQEDLETRMVDLEKKAKKLEFKIHQAKNISYIERQATDQFDYVREGDLIFVFAD